MLAVTQLGAHLNHQIFRGQRIERRQFGNQCLRQRTAAGTKLQQRAAGKGVQHLGALTGQAAPEQHAQLGRRDKITSLAELAQTRSVVAQLRLVQHRFHVAIKRQRAACLLNAAPHVPGNTLTMTERRRGGHWQR